MAVLGARSDHSIYDRILQHAISIYHHRYVHLMNRHLHLLWVKNNDRAKLYGSVRTCYHLVPRRCLSLSRLGWLPRLNRRRTHLVRLQNVSLKAHDHSGESTQTWDVQTTWSLDSSVVQRSNSMMITEHNMLLVSSILLRLISDDMLPAWAICCCVFLDPDRSMVINPAKAMDQKTTSAWMMTDIIVSLIYV